MPGCSRLRPLFFPASLATQQPWCQNYRMASYVERELPGLISSELPADVARQSIMGHSMGDTAPLPLEEGTP